MAAGTPDIGGLLASIMGGGGPSPGGPGGPGGDPGPGGPPPDQGGGDDVPALLQQALDLIHKAFALETEPIDKAAIAKIQSAIQDLFAQEQKEKDQALGGGGLRKMAARNR